MSLETAVLGDGGLEYNTAKVGSILAENWDTDVIERLLRFGHDVRRTWLPNLQILCCSLAHCLIAL